MTDSQHRDLMTLYPQDEVPLWSSVPGPGEGVWGNVVRAMREGRQGRFPPRYGPDAWRKPFDERLRASLPRARAILDVGAGALPTVPTDQRPAGAVYIGLDIDEGGLHAAPRGSYDEVIVADITRPRQELRQRFDLVLSWFVLEHVASLPAALSVIRSYLRPGGRLLAQFSGRHAVFSVFNRLVPARFAAPLLGRTTGRRRESVFPAHYDECRHDAIERLLGQGWTQAEVVPLFVAGLYFRFSRPLLGAYLGYEEVAWQRPWRNLAPYYLVDARREPGRP